MATDGQSARATPAPCAAGARPGYASGVDLAGMWLAASMGKRCKGSNRPEPEKHRLRAILSFFPRADTAQRAPASHATMCYQGLAQIPAIWSTCSGNKLGRLCSSAEPEGSRYISCGPSRCESSSTRTRLPKGLTSLDLSRSPSQKALPSRPDYSPHYRITPPSPF